MRLLLSVGFGWLVLMSSLSNHLCAQEAVIYWQKPKPSAESTLFSSPVEMVRGTLNGMDKQSVFYTPDGETQPVKIPADQVVGIHVSWTDPKVVEANAAYSNSDFTKAILLLQDLAGHPPGRWQQSLLVLRLASANEAGRHQAAAAKVFVIAQSLAIPAFTYAYAPLLWSNEPVEPAVLGELEKEFGDKNDSLSQLILSSWRLSSAKREDALATLESLVKKNDEPISMLAKAQLWRVIPPQKFVSEQLDEVLKFRDKMPFGLQAGPTAVIANQFERSGDYDTAFDYWTEVAIAAKYAQLPLLYIASSHLDDIANRQGRVEQWNALKEILKKEK